MTKRRRTLILIAVLMLVSLTLSGCGVPTGDINLDQPQGVWQSFIVFPLTKALIFLNDAIAGAGIPFSWGWAIILFTIIVKVLTLPLTAKQLQSTKATQELQPRLKELQEKYGKDKQKLSEEQMKLYKEAGVNPFGGCLPLLIQMPVLFGLYQALYVLASPGVHKLQGAPWLWIPDLSFPDPATGMGWITTYPSTGQYGLLIAYFSLPVIMIISQVILQKMGQPLVASTTSKNDQGQMMGQMMMFMPIMFGYITLGLPAGLTLYWSISNILSIIQQYYIGGWGSLVKWIPALKGRPAVMERELVETPGVPANLAVDRPKRRRRRK